MGIAFGTGLPVTYQGQTSPWGLTPFASQPILQPLAQVLQSFQVASHQLQQLLQLEYLQLQQVQQVLQNVPLQLQQLQQLIQFIPQLQQLPHLAQAQAYGQTMSTPFIPPSLGSPYSGPTHVM